MRVYTDGSCKLMTGGWAWWNEDSEEYESGCEVPSTNQRMELFAAIDAIDHHLDDEELVIISDSTYLVNCFNERWWEGWDRRVGRTWRNARGKPIENQDLWMKLLGLVQAHGNVHFEWVRGHTKDPGNEHADMLAGQAMLLALGDGR